MPKWELIETAPKDGSIVWVRRVYEGRVVKEGWALFGLPCAEAPMLQPLPPDPLGKVHPEIMHAEIDDCVQAALTPRWLLENRMFAFPEPTHWAPPPPE